jgi:hypothetical protein
VQLMHGAQMGDPAMPVNRSLRMLWRAESCSAKEINTAVETALGK